MLAIIILFKFLTKSYAEDVLSTCVKEKPFKLDANNCASFNDVCVKRGDEQCRSVMNACRQCPASNFTEITLREIFYELKDHVTNSKMLEKQVLSIVIAVIIVVIINLILITCLICILDQKYGWKNRFFPKKKKEPKSDIENSENIRLLATKKTLNSNMCYQDQPTSLLINFKIKKTGKIIKLLIQENDNVIKIKRAICIKWINAKSDDYKIMKLKFNGEYIEDNGSLSNIHIYEGTSIECEIDENIKSSDIVVLQIQGIESGIDLIQINKNQNVDNLKMEINKLIKIMNPLIFYESKPSQVLIELNNELILYKCGFVDFDFIKVLAKKTGYLKIYSIFPEGKKLSIEYSNTELVEVIRSKISQAIKSADIILFFNNELMSDKSFMFQFDMNEKSKLTYCNFVSKEIFPMNNGVIDSGDSCDIFEARHGINNQIIIMKRYGLDSSMDLTENKAFIKELITFQITQSNPRFINIFGLCKESKYLYIACEKISEKSVRHYLDKNFPLEETLIVKWCKQILEGIQFLHSNNIIHRNIKPTNIMVDENNDIKISSFGFSKYLQGYDSSYLVQGFIQSKVGNLRYMAPEVSLSEPYGIKADIWSFGATLIEIVTNKPPYFEMNETNAMIKIMEQRIIQYNKDNTMSTKLVNFIDRCLQSNPLERPTADELLLDTFLNV